jgi:retinol dehydrogenase 12
MSDSSPQPKAVIAVITGANTGIGRVTAIELAQKGARVFLTGRSEEKTRPVLAEIARKAPAANPEFLPLDLADLESVRRCANDFLRRGLRLELLVNNAGLAGQRGYTKSGFELAFGVNHVGHFLFTQLLLDRIKQSAPARIVTVASQAHYRVKTIDFDAVRRPTRSLTGLHEYGVSKLANVLFSAELARHLAGSGVTTYAVHPGVVASEIWRRIPLPFRWLMKRSMISPEEGARTSLYCATSPELASQTGLYYDRCRPKTPSAAAQDTALAAELWRRSEEWIRPQSGRSAQPDVE